MDIGGKKDGGARIGFRCAAGAHHDLGGCRRSLSFGSTGRRGWRGKHHNYGVPWARVGDVVGCLLCRRMPGAPGGAVGFFVNGVPCGV
eukprot:SAG22_NODE_5974_length_923_cov_1.377427_1_plen_87_part_10